MVVVGATAVVVGASVVVVVVVTVVVGASVVVVGVTVVVVVVVVGFAVHCAYNVKSAVWVCAAPVVISVPLVAAVNQPANA